MDSPEFDSDHDKTIFRSPFSLYSNVRNACKVMRKARPGSTHFNLGIHEEPLQGKKDQKKKLKGWIVNTLTVIRFWIAS